MYESCYLMDSTLKALMIKKSGKFLFSFSLLCGWKKLQGNNGLEKCEDKNADGGENQAITLPACFQGLHPFLSDLRYQVPASIDAEQKLFRLLSFR